jgi:hypothetical protein
MKKVLLLFFILIGNFCSGQVTFQKAIGDFGYNDAAAIQQTSDGGYIMAGTYFDAYARIYVVKTDSAGNATWTKFYSYFDVLGSSIQQAADGGYIISGFSLDVPFSTYIIKINTVGDTLWSKKIYNDNHDLGYSVIQASDANYVAAGITTDGTTYVNARVTKLDSAGATLWNNGYTSAFSFVELIPYSVQQANDGGYVMAGYINNTATVYDMVLMKTDSDGVYQWNRWYGGNDSDFAYSVQPASDNGFIMVGETKSFGAGEKDVYLVKTNSAGDTLWTRTYGGTGIDIGKCVWQANDGGYIIAGYTESFGAGMKDVYVIKTDGSGAVQWSRTFGGALDDEAAAVQQTTDGGYILAGYTESFGVNRDMYLIKLDSAGNSACNQANAATVSGFAATQIALYNLIPGSVGSIDNYQWVSGIGGSASPICIAGISKAELPDVMEIYPNPARNTFTISFNGQLTVDNGQLEVYNIVGQKVYADEIHSQLSTVNCQLNPGIYFVRLTAGERVFTEKLVVE